MSKIQIYFAPITSPESYKLERIKHALETLDDVKKMDKMYINLPNNSAKVKITLPSAKPQKSIQLDQ